MQDPIKLLSMLSKQAAAPAAEVPATVAVQTSPPEVTEAPAAPAGGRDPAPERPQAQSKVISDDLLTMLSQQVGNESYACYDYYGAAGWFKLKGLDGFAKWCESQAAGEIAHARKVYDHIILAGSPAALPAITQARPAYDSIQSACEAILAREMAVTADWRAICKQALKDADGASLGLATWFLTEQLEEENAAATLLDRVRMAGGEGPGILVIDADLKG